MQDFHRIDAWKRAHALALEVRKATSAFPRRGFAELKAQIIDAAESIPTNIVEGCGASSRKEFARYLDISIKSTFELEYQLLLAKDNGAMPPLLSQRYSNEAVEIRRMLCAFRQSVLRADDAERERSASERRRAGKIRGASAQLEVRPHRD
jgi:four helix bundle protein